MSISLRAVAILLVLGLPATAWAQTAVKWGYIEVPDGTKLRYTLWLPEGDGPFPVLMQYEGYSAGSEPSRANDKFVPRMLAKGYAVIGVSLRGSGCSTGTWQLFDLQQAEDGAFAVEWIARQPWSNGKVAMFSYSYSGIMQLWVASMNPPHLVAAAPGMPVADTYRDIAYPGGIPNVSFPPVWGASLNADWTLAARAALLQGDLECQPNYLMHAGPNNLDPLALDMVSHPFDDAWHYDHSVANRAHLIRMPVLAVRSWQDEETGGRQSGWFESLNPETTWLINTNGHHLMYQHSISLIENLEAFYDYHLKGIDNGFDRRPRVQIWHETSVGEMKPRSITTVPRLPVKVETRALFLTPEGELASRAATAEPGTPTSYPYPVPSPAVVDGSSQAQESPRINTWSLVPGVSEGRAVFTTPPLARTVTTYGSASADLWVSTTAPDVDLQVTITEVRPDGQEVYVQRGWLRASHRALDARRSTVLQPYHPHTAEAQADMPLGEPQLLRVEMVPFSYAFRAGSSIRMYVEYPSATGLWNFAAVSTPQVVSIHHDRSHPSQLLLGLLPEATLLADYPDCALIHSQPCRDNTTPPPAGSIDIAPRTGSAPGSGQPARSGGGSLDLASLLLGLGFLLVRRRVRR